ncbi:hypothetical protein [Rhodococcus sp. 14-2470-1a]|uniref:hypothetical protein n=1 Tax=Rhodococcus sp. 14-2470-1a TaxID=2023150 RepID=UPI000B9AEEDA|nr:hypothetical protein [Rhodococcus sp. 14-2470-1a]OZF44270.1 hypothetical protein CH292_24550 [Rhodococcus sp. 14-2470-1a]
MASADEYDWVRIPAGQVTPGDTLGRVENGQPYMIRVRSVEMSYVGGVTKIVVMSDPENGKAKRITFEDWHEAIKLVRRRAA